MIIIDTETGGLDPRRHALLSIAAVRVGDTGAAFWGLIRPAPNLECDPKAEIVHGLSKEFLEDQGMEEREVLEHFFAWLGKTGEVEWAGANPQFDRGFIEEAAARHVLPVTATLNRRPVDVQTLGWLADRLGLIVLPEKGGRKSASLASLCLALGMEGRVGKMHSALEDAGLTARVYVRLMALFHTCRGGGQ